jgi:hypothetical protein
MPFARLKEVVAVISQEASYLFDFTISYYMEATPNNVLTHTFVGLPFEDFLEEIVAWAQLQGFQWR